MASHPKWRPNEGVVTVCGDKRSISAPRPRAAWPFARTAARDLSEKPRLSTEIDSTSPARARSSAAARNMASRLQSRGN
jgi:hypothetical protein